MRSYINSNKIPFSDILFEATETGVSQDYSVFFMDYSEFSTAFESFSIAHTRQDQNYQISWYDVEDNTGTIEDLLVIPSKQQGDIYFTVHSYPLNSIPLTDDCFTSSTQPSYTLTVDKGDSDDRANVLDTVSMTDNYPQSIQVLEASYVAGESIYARV